MKLLKELMESFDEIKVVDCKPDDGGYNVTVDFNGTPVVVWMNFDEGGSMGGHSFSPETVYSLPVETQNDILNAALGADFDECDAKYGAP